MEDDSETDMTPVYIGGAVVGLVLVAGLGFVAGRGGGGKTVRGNKVFLYKWSVCVYVI